MAFSKEILKELEMILMTPRSSSDVILSFLSPVKSVKKHKEKFNWALQEIYKKHQPIKMKNIICGLDHWIKTEELFDEKLKLLDDKNRILVVKECSDEIQDGLND